MGEDPESWHPRHDVEEGTGPSGNLETKRERTEPDPGAEQPVAEDGEGAAGAGVMTAPGRPRARRHRSARPAHMGQHVQLHLGGRARGAASADRFDR